MVAADTETLLQEIPCSQADRRLCVYLQKTDCGSCMVLRAESYAEGIGWFGQQTIAVEPEQVQALRQAIGAAPSAPSAKAFRPIPADCPFRVVS